VTGPVQGGGGVAKTAVKVSLAVVGAGLGVGVLSTIGKYAMNSDSSFFSFLNIASGWLMFLGIVLTVLSGVIYLLVRSSSARRPLPQATHPGQPSGMAPGWYPDQNDPKLMRWFDGQKWTSGTAPRE
jgi:hypothetical protein